MIGMPKTPGNATPAIPTQDGGVGSGGKSIELPLGQPGDFAEQQRRAREQERLAREKQEQEEAAAREMQEREAERLATMQAEINRLKNASDPRYEELEREYLRREKQLRDEAKKREEKKERERKLKANVSDVGFFAKPKNIKVVNAPPAGPNPRPMAEKPNHADRQPLTDDQLAQVLEDLNSGDPVRELQALDVLAQALPSGDRPRVAALVAKHLDAANHDKHLAAAKALAIWSTSAEVPLLIELLGEQDKETRVAVIHALGALRAQQAADRLADRLAEDRTAASAALESIGNAAEPAVIQRLAHDNLWVRSAAIDVLSKIGGQAGNEALQRVAVGDSEEMIRNKANDVLRRLGERQELGAIK